MRNRFDQQSVGDWIFPNKLPLVTTVM